MWVGSWVVGLGRCRGFGYMSWVEKENFSKEKIKIKTLIGKKL